MEWHKATANHVVFVLPNLPLNFFYHNHYLETMSAPIHPTFAYYSDYADPLIRPASPATSVGTQYEPDQTSFSDSEEQLSDAALDRKYTEKNGAEDQRRGEIQAENDPLLTFPVPGGKSVRIGDRKLEPQDEQGAFLPFQSLTPAVF